MEAVAVSGGAGAGDGRWNCGRVEVMATLEGIMAGMLYRIPY